MAKPNRYNSVGVTLDDIPSKWDNGEPFVIKGGQVLLLRDSDVPGWWDFKIKNGRGACTGNISQYHARETEAISTATARRDFIAREDGDLTITKRETLLLYCVDEEWALVKGVEAVGYVPRRCVTTGEAIQTTSNRHAGPMGRGVSRHMDVSVAKSRLIARGSGDLSQSINQATFSECLVCQGGSSDVYCGKIPPISRFVPAHGVVSQLAVYGCEDLTQHIDASTFGDHPTVIGGLSDIYHGSLTDGTPVAVKALRIPAQQSLSESTRRLRRAAREIHAWRKCEHTNLLELFGLAMFRDRVVMVSPWMNNGTLPRFLAANPNANRRDLCVQICEGLSYMHDNGIIHGDLKGANVLISNDGVAVLADFGSSTIKGQSLKFTPAARGKALSVRWLAPELVLAKNYKHTKASDVFALAMTIYEVLTGKVPYHEIQNVARVIKRIIQREPPMWTVAIPNGHESEGQLWDLLMRCWNHVPEDRPNAIEVTEMFKAIPLEGVAYHITPEICPRRRRPVTNSINGWAGRGGSLN